MRIAMTTSFNDDTYQSVCVTVNDDGSRRVWVDGVYRSDLDVEDDD